MASAVGICSDTSVSGIAKSLPETTLKKSWIEIRQAVRKSHRGANTMMNRIPHNLILATNVANLSRLYFSSVPSGQRENTILFVDFLSNDASQPPGNNIALEWHQFLDSFQSYGASNSGQMSKEEQLLRERKRLRSYGITGYDYQKVGVVGHFAFSAANSVFVCSDSFDGVHQPPVSVNEVKTGCVNSRLDPKLCPIHPDLLAFVSGLDLWVTCISSGCERRLTFARKGLKNLADDAVSAAVPSFVVQEEFNRYTGYWWQPRSTSQGSTTEVFRILYEEVDESEVDILNIISPQKEASIVDQYRYPKAGTANAKCTLKMVEFSVDPLGNIDDIVEKQLLLHLSEMFPWMEYLVRAGWLPDGSRIYVEMMNRRQTQLQLVLMDLGCFWGTIDDESEMEINERSSVPCNMWTLYQETSTEWINVNDLLYFFRHQSANCIQFIWGSAKSGYTHLYFVTVSLDKSYVHQHESSCCAKADMISEVQLTSGEWEVDSKQVWVDEERRLVYFVGYKDTPLETHLYVVSINLPGVIIRLTKPDFSHSITMDEACSQFATVYSSLRLPPACELYHLDHFHDIQQLSTHLSGIIMNPSELQCWTPPTLFSFTSTCGSTMYGMMYTPDGLDVHNKYPVVLFVYAGPHVQLVTNSYKALRFLRLHTLASVGYVVVVIDGRGSCNRGVKFEAYIRSQLGTVEVADQVEGLNWLASTYSFIDMDRVAIHGWSYGGYISLMGLVQRPDIFKVAVAGAPVTSWLLYDTGYTERFLDLPNDNPAAYSNGSVIELVDKFPNEDGRLLLVHGLIDENVHFCHTRTLVEALVKSCKPHQLQVYPCERHGIRSPEANEHYETLLISFLQRNL